MPNEAKVDATSPEVLTAAENYLSAQIAFLKLAYEVREAVRRHIAAAMVFNGVDPGYATDMKDYEAALRLVRGLKSGAS